MHYIAQSLTAINDRCVVLRWMPNIEPDLAGYHVYMSIGGGGSFVKMTTDPLKEAEYVSPILRPDTRYFFRITAIDNSGNESPPSVTLEYQLPQ